MERMLQWFKYDHLPAGPIRDASKPFCELAQQVADKYPINAERTVALRKLLESKDAAVRAALPTT
jgi:hypothetical protein